MDIESGLISASATTTAAATATTAAAAISATATAGATTTTASVSTAATAGAGGIFFRTGFFDANGLAVERSAVEHFNGRFCPFLRNHFHETEASGLA